MSLILRDIIHFVSKLLSSPCITYSLITVCSDRLERGRNRIKSKRRLQQRDGGVYLSVSWSLQMVTRCLQIRHVLIKELENSVVEMTLSESHSRSDQIIQQNLWSLEYTSLRIQLIAFSKSQRPDLTNSVISVRKGASGDLYIISKRPKC